MQNKNKRGLVRSSAFGREKNIGSSAQKGYSERPYTPDPHYSQPPAYSHSNQPYQDYSHQQQHNQYSYPEKPNSYTNYQTPHPSSSYLGKTGIQKEGYYSLKNNDKYYDMNRKVTSDPYDSKSVYLEEGETHPGDTITYDDYSNPAIKGKITEIRGFWNGYVLGLEVLYDNISAGAHIGNLGGTATKKFNTFPLSPNEYITEIFGRSSKVINQIGFLTNQGRTCTFGENMGGKSFMLTVRDSVVKNMKVGVGGHLHLVGASFMPLSGVPRLKETEAPIMPERYDNTYAESPSYGQMGLTNTGTLPYHATSPQKATGYQSRPTTSPTYYQPSSSQYPPQHPSQYPSQQQSQYPSQHQTHQPYSSQHQTNQPYPSKHQSQQAYPTSTNSLSGESKSPPALPEISTALNSRHEGAYFPSLGQFNHALSLFPDSQSLGEGGIIQNIKIMYGDEGIAGLQITYYVFKIGARLVSEGRNDGYGLLVKEATLNSGENIVEVSGTYDTNGIRRLTLRTDFNDSFIDVGTNGGKFFNLCIPKGRKVIAFAGQASSANISSIGAYYV